MPQRRWPDSCLNESIVKMGDYLDETRDPGRSGGLGPRHRVRSHRHRPGRLSVPPRADRGAVPARRQHRHPDARHGGSIVHRAQAAVHGRQQARRRRQHRRGLRRQQRSRRLHLADGAARHPCRQCLSLRKAAVRHGEVVRADHDGGAVSQRAGGAPVARRQIDRGVDRQGQGRARQDRFRDVGRRLDQPSLHFVVHGDGRHRDESHPLQGHQPVAAGCHHRPRRR